MLFERHESKKQTCEYKFYTEFQSHEPEFDYLKSLEIEEKINKIRWCRRQNQAHFLLSTNGEFHSLYIYNYSSLLFILTPPTLLLPLNLLILHLPVFVSSSTQSVSPFYAWLAGWMESNCKLDPLY